MVPAWEGNALVAELPPGAWEIRAEVILGGLRHAWTVQHTAVEGRVSLVDLAVPADAWLDDLAATYLTHLGVKLVGTTDAARGHVVRAPRAWLVWPTGPSAAPVVWDEATQQRAAPLGVLDPALAALALAAEAETTWVVPPIATAPVQRLAPEEE